MNFDFSDDQKFLKSEAAGSSKLAAPTSKVRAYWMTQQNPTTPTFWKEVAGQGWLGAAIPESYGGLGLGHLELCVIAEELGRALAPIPFASTAYFLAEALMLAGSEAQKAGLAAEDRGRRNHRLLRQRRAAWRAHRGAGAGRVEGGKLTGRQAAGHRPATSPTWRWCWRAKAGGSACSWSNSAAPAWRARRCRRWIPPAASPSLPSAARRRSGWRGRRGPGAGGRAAGAGGGAAGVRTARRRGTGAGNGQGLRDGALCLRPADRQLPRRSSTSWPTCTSRTSSPALPPTTAPGRWRLASQSCRWPRRRRGSRLRGLLVRRQGKICRPTAASASPGRWTASVLPPRPAARPRRRRAKAWKERLVRQLERRNAA